MFIDTHCHLSLDYYDDIDKVLNDNHDMGVSKIIVSGCDKKGIKESLFLLISIVIYMLVLDFIQILLRRLYKKI